MKLWVQLMRHWALVEPDLHQFYQVDLDDLGNRTWRWLQVRILGLLSIPPQVYVFPNGEAHTLPQTRIGNALKE